MLMLGLMSLYYCLKGGQCSPLSGFPFISWEGCLISIKLIKVTISTMILIDVIHKTNV